VQNQLKEDNMVENIISLLIYIAVVVGIFYLIEWVLGMLGVPLPAKVIQVGWVIAVLVILLLVWRAFSPFIGGNHLFSH
jgi:uncharacterized membrane protein (DUF485 family)